MLAKFQEKDVRIIIGAFSAQFARKVFCQAYRIQLYGPRYVWLIPGSFPSNWWLDQRDNSDCSNEELEEAIEGYLSVTVATGGASEVTPGFTAGIVRTRFFYGKFFRQPASEPVVRSAKFKLLNCSTEP